MSKSENFSPFQFLTYLEQTCFFKSKEEAAVYTVKTRRDESVSIAEVLNGSSRDSREVEMIMEEMVYLHSWVFSLIPLKRELKEERSLENVTASYQFTLYCSWYFSEDGRNKRTHLASGKENFSLVLDHSAMSASIPTGILSRDIKIFLKIIFSALYTRYGLWINY